MEVLLVQQELRTQFMAANGPEIVFEGFEEITKRDLEKHKALLARSKIELLAYREARSYEIKKKKHYISLIGGSKYNDDALRTSIDSIAVNIQHFSDKVKLTEEAIAHHTLIVDTLTKQLEEQYKGLEALAKYRKDHPNASNN